MVTRRSFNCSENRSNRGAIESLELEREGDKLVNAFRNAFEAEILEDRNLMPPKDLMSQQIFALERINRWCIRSHEEEIKGRKSSSGLRGEGSEFAGKGQWIFLGARMEQESISSVEIQPIQRFGRYRAAASQMNNLRWPEKTCQRKLRHSRSIFQKMQRRIDMTPEMSARSKRGEITGVAMVEPKGPLLREWHISRPRRKIRGDDWREVIYCIRRFR